MVSFKFVSMLIKEVPVERREWAGSFAGALLWVVDTRIVSVDLSACAMTP